MADINTDQHHEVTLRPKNDAGGDALVQAGSVIWASSDDTKLQIVVDPLNEMKARFNYITPGVGVLATATADADLGDGVVTLTVVSEPINITQGPSSAATTMVMDLGAPIDN